MGRHVGVPSEGHQHGGRKPAKTSGVYLGYFKALLLSAELSHINIDVSITCYMLAILLSRTAQKSKIQTALFSKEKKLSS